MSKTMPASRLFMDRHYGPLNAAMRAGGARAVASAMGATLGEDRILAKLELTHPGEQVFFGSDASDSDRTRIFELVGALPQDFRRTLSECPTVDARWVIANKPFNWLMAMVIKWYAEHRDEAERTAVMYMAVSFYATLQFKYFRRFYQPNVMAYAMNSLSDKFILKQEGTMLKALSSIAWRSHQKYLPLLRSGDDRDLFTYFVSVWSRVNGMVKGLKNQYEQTKASGAYLNRSKLTYDDGEYVERSTEGGRVRILADRACEALVGEPVPQRLVQLAAQMADIPRQSLSVAVNEMRSGDLERIREVFSLILELYFDEKGTDVRTRAFLAHAHAVYVRSNTKDGRVEAVKARLGEILTECSPQYLRTNRGATKSAFRRALYLFLVLFLQQSS
jgi:hypothetical protein